MYSIEDWALGVTLNNNVYFPKEICDMEMDIDADAKPSVGEGEAWAEYTPTAKRVKIQLTTRYLPEDAGQDALSALAHSGQETRFTVACSHGKTFTMEGCVTGMKLKADKDGQTAEWTISGIGSATNGAIKRITGLAFTKDGSGVTSVSVEEGESVTIGLEYTPSDATDRRILIWTGNGLVADVATNENGTITLRGTGAGTATIHADAYCGNAEAELAVTVTGSEA